MRCECAVAPSCRKANIAHVRTFLRVPHRSRRPPFRYAGLVKVLSQPSAGLAGKLYNLVDGCLRGCTQDFKTRDMQHSQPTNKQRCSSIIRGSKWNMRVCLDKGAACPAGKQGATGPPVDVRRLPANTQLPVSWLPGTRCPAGKKEGGQLYRLYTSEVTSL